MATMTKAERRAERLRNIVKRVAEAFEIVNGTPANFSDVTDCVTAWHRMAERLRKRWESECSYVWANTESYAKGTEREEKRLIAAVKLTGLHVYLQSDPRGATLYVDSKPIPDDNYTQAICICLD